MDTVTHSPALPSRKPPTIHSCQRCAVRKIRCDKQQPCAACVRLKVECEYRILAPPKRKRKPDRNEVLVRRLEQCERSLRRKLDDSGAPLKAPPNPSNSSLTANGRDLASNEGAPLQIPDPPITGPSGNDPQKQLNRDHSRSKYHDDALWARVIEELGDPADVLEHSSDEDGDEDDAAPDSMDFVLGLTPMPRSITLSHPSSDQIVALWHVFLENIDPLTKVVHGPSLQPAIHKAALDPSSVSRSLEALLFAIYGAAVVSLKDHDCEQRFGESRKALLSRYHVSTKAALSRAKFVGSANLAVLQAFYIHLLSMRELYESRTLWTLVGVALRMAEGMGLHRDGSFQGLPLFETEMRRRLWWQLRILDGDSAEICGFDKFRTLTADLRNPQLPSNINDDEMSPEMSSLITTTERATDMVFCALRCDLRTYWITNPIKELQRDKGDSIWTSWSRITTVERDKAIDKFEKALEDKFIRYCDPSQPIQFMATLSARAAVSTVRLVAHHPRMWACEEKIPESERRYIWNLSIKCLKQYNMVQLSRELERFSWNAGMFFRWPAFLHILDTLRANPLVEDASQVWHLIDELYESKPDLVSNTKKALYVAVGNLCLKAYSAREAALAKQGKPKPTIPSYIKTFRRQREAANARRRDREVVVKNAEKPNELHAITQSIPTARQGLPNPAERLQEQPLHSTQVLQRSLPQATTSHRLELSGAGRAPGLPDRSNGFSDGLFTFTDDNADIDLDMLLSMDASMENPMTQTMDWVKWDALLSDFT